MAIDQSTDMLARVREQAVAAGLTDRIRTVHANLDDGWPATGPVDVVWASMSLHHMADPDRTLKDTMTALRPAGVLAVVEIDGQPRFLPDDIGIGRRGLETRFRAALEGRLAAEDLATLDRLLDEHGADHVVHRKDLTVRTVRTAWVVQQS